MLLVCVCAHAPVYVCVCVGAPVCMWVLLCVCVRVCVLLCVCTLCSPRFPSYLYCTRILSTFHFARCITKAYTHNARTASEYSRGVTILTAHLHVRSSFFSRVALCLARSGPRLITKLIGSSYSRNPERAIESRRRRCRHVCAHV